MAFFAEKAFSSFISNNRTILVFLLLWSGLNLLQAYFTGLFNDEAYYFFYSRHLAWGYYDHPPLVALLIRAGYAVFHNELGVRLVVELLAIVTVLILHQLTGKKNDHLFVALFFSFLVFHITGFMAIPDSVLIFFTAIFFLAYKKFTLNDNHTHAIMLGVAMAGMFYAKYLGLFIVIFTVMSNFRLLLNTRFWLAVAVTTIVFLPHLWWQYQHDFPSAYYHLLERSHDESFRWSNFGDFFAGQLALINPLLFFPVIFYLFRYKAVNAFERALKYSAIGSLLLPVLLMLRGRVEANWTMAGLVPVFIIAFQAFENRPKLRKYLYYSFGLSFLLIMTIRVLLSVNFLPESYRERVRLETHGWKDLSSQISILAGDRPVVFVSSYQNASQYAFYQQKEAFSFNSVLYRNNQYDLEGIEKKLQGKEVMIVIPGSYLTSETKEEYGLMLTDSVRSLNGKTLFCLTEKEYRSYNFLPLSINTDLKGIPAGRPSRIDITLKNPGPEPIHFIESGPGSTKLTFSLLKQGKPLIYEEFETLSGLVLNEEYRTSFILNAPEEPGTYYIRVSVKHQWMPPGINGRIHPVTVQ